MKLIYGDIDAEVTELESGSVLTIGNFDGVHQGHQVLLAKLHEVSQKLCLPAVVLSFSPHPAKVFSPETSPKMIMTEEQKAEILSLSSVDAYVRQSFTKEFAAKSPEWFLETFLQKYLNVKHIIVGHDFSFGAKRTGTIETLMSFGEKNGVGIDVIPAVFDEDTLISSTLIRQLLGRGDVKLARKYLTRFHFIDGTVVHGHKRGGKIGIHTANLETTNELLPADGVYATFVEVMGKQYQSVTNIGFNPTFHETKRSIETHVFDFEKDIYGQPLRLHFVERLRDEMSFENPDDLVKQIHHDMEKAKKILKTNEKERV
jgi:riboflavin kinase/FMN adenylyltransferase